jgi:hypothetical protein
VKIIKNQKIEEMKTIDKLTEQEILKLSEQEVVQMIKFRMASEGIKILDRPEKPQLHKIPTKDKVVYKCSLFGGHLVCEDVDELKGILDQVKASSTACSISSEYDGDNDTNHILTEFKKVGWGSKDWDIIETQKVYSDKLFAEIESMIGQNKKITEKHEAALKEYTESQEGVTDIQNEIWDRVREVQEKYYNLNLHVERFKTEYMPLAGNDEAVAMNFLVKAYRIKDDEQEYVLKNYKSK